ncbi:uncharacterized protein LOC119613770 isoform X1 [Lucilia sericata]|uniref:uncharacterized protein LOC119613770 isoform X1 n=1 Tax=Lucilia sericata TaxID=13632 RepID=UPI0018A821F3|nr:uncharacterized protein LOC119613770 isoform X1 [Lucilia sericata]XP_037825735.1 uncharacterized protein LOC119613770 isoform X1 [Lucilia sericata]
MSNMSSTERKKRSLYQYSEESLKNALKEIRAGTSSILRASKKYGVPRSTIQDRIHGRIADNAKKIGSHTVLSEDEEECVVKWCEAHANNGVTLKAKDLLDTVEAIVKKRQRSTPFINGRPGRRWYWGFSKRHPHLKFREIKGILKQTDSTTEPKTKKHKVKEVTSDTPVQQSTIRPPSNNGFAAGANESYFPPNQHFTAIEMPQQPQKQQQQQQPPHSQQKQQHQEQQATSRTTDSCQQIAQIWGLKLAKMSRMQRIIAEKVINEVMFNGELGLLNLNTGLTHIGSRIDTDPISSIDAENEQEFITIENKNIFDL